MAQDSLFEAYFDGNDIKPGVVRSKDIGDVITAFEEVVASMIVCEHPNLDIRKDSIIIGLKEVKTGSCVFAFDANDVELSISALNNISRAFQNNSLISLPLDTRKSLEVIVGFTKKYACSLKTRFTKTKSETLFSLDADTKIPYPPLIRGETTLYGQITRVGGADADSPTIQFKVLSGQLIYCGSNKNVALLAGKRLYEQAALRGTAEWDPEENQVKSFFASEILDYESTDPLEAFGALAERFGNSFGSVWGNVDEFVSSLRED